MSLPHQGLKVVPVKGFDVAFDTAGFPLAEQHRAAIDANFAEAKARTPALFDGQVLLATAWGVEGGRLKARMVATRYAAFLYWKRLGFPDLGIRNLFGAAVVHAADGGVLLGRMSARTANPGRIYFPCGTPDMGDVRGGEVDIEGSISRELTEETGLAPPVVRATAERYVIETPTMIACLRRHETALTGAELLAAAELHLAADPHEELDAVMVARSGDELDPEAVPDFVRAYADQQLKSE